MQKNNTIAEALQRVSGMVLLSAIALTSGTSFLAAYLFMIAGFLYFLSNINEKYVNLLRSGIYCVIMLMPAVSYLFDPELKNIVFFTIFGMIGLYYILEVWDAKKERK